ncbi:MFS transporter [Streptomyces sp. NPDC000070]|uniref:MFS transporter n=1 Tax=Streptomyces sp. NPDC000070 TaxID=3154240 RepID=UPI00331B9FA2
MTSPARPLPTPPPARDAAPPLVAETSATPGPGPIVAVLAFTGIVISALQTLLVPIIADLPALLHTSASNAGWAITATLLSGAVATPITGRLGDLYGKRRMLLACLGAMVAGSLIAGFTSQLGILLAGRVLQGFALGSIPLAISILRDVLPPERLASATGLISASVGIGGALALPSAALIAQHFDWHLLFFGPAGLGLLAIALILWAVPEPTLRAAGGFDGPGAVGLAAALVALLLAITKGGDWGWVSGPTLGLFAAAAVILLGWGVLELRTSAPLVDLRTSVSRQTVLTNIIAVTLGISIYTVTLVESQLLQLPTATGFGLGLSQVAAGLSLAPMGVAMMLAAPLSARITAAHGPRVALVLGLLVLTTGYGAGLVLMDAVWQVIVAGTVIGVGVGLASATLPTLIMGAVDPTRTGAANALNALMRSIGSSVCSAVVAAVLAHQVMDFHGTPVPDLSGFRTSFVITVAALLLALVLAALLPSENLGSERQDLAQIMQPP